MLTTELKESFTDAESIPVLFRVARGANWVWLALLVFPLTALLEADVTTLHLVLALIGFGAFAAAFATLVLSFRRPVSLTLSRSLVGLMFCIAFAMTAAERANWVSMFIYPAAVASMWTLFSKRIATIVVVACIGSATALVAASGLGAGAVLSTATTGGGIGLMMLCFGAVRDRNCDLVRARDEIARLAVNEERLRFARDLHDLLGHSLSVIALKAELAGRMLDRDVQEAALHVEDLERVARDALAEVRQAASGYRQPVLSSELDGARMALEAAGIESSFERCETRLAPHAEALLAWTVREGTTNVIRHSDARTCRVEIHAGIAQVSVEVIDDGGGGVRAQRHGMTRASTTAGHGLAGLRERAQRLGGELEAGPAPGGGFHLRVVVPATAAPEPPVGSIAAAAPEPPVGSIAAAAPEPPVGSGAGADRAATAPDAAQAARTIEAAA
jgi:two-component system sensor histidine kinase DesK